jgi:predicted ATP-dependent serine protease
MAASPGPRYWNTWLIRFFNLRVIAITPIAYSARLRTDLEAQDELGIYEMTDKGMRGVNNPSEVLITQKDEQLSGIAIAATIEGIRPLLIEVQALVTQSVYGTPQRTV